MPFGPRNALTTLASLMKLILRGLYWKTCLVYMDDTTLLWPVFDKHVKNWEDLFLGLWYESVDEVKERRKGRS